MQLLFEEELGEALLSEHERSRPAAGLVSRRRGGGMGAGFETGGGTGGDAGEASASATDAGGAALEAAAGAAASAASEASAASAASAASEAEYAALAQALPLSLLLRVCNHVLSAPFEDERHLVHAMRRPSPSSPPDVALFRISIRRADATGRVLRTHGGGGGSARTDGGGAGGGAGRRGGGALVLLRGDALFTPHYRLGVGVNHAMVTLPHLSTLLSDAWGRGGRAALRDVGPNGAAWRLLERWEARVGAEADVVVSRQLRTIFLEARCGLHAFGERAFRRVPATRTLQPLSAAETAALSC